MSDSQSLSAWRSWRVFSIDPMVPQVMGSGSGAWSDEHVALMVAFIEAVTAWVARRQVTPTTSPALAEGQAVRLPDGMTATVVKV